MPNQYKNKVVYGDSVLMDITDTTAEAGDVASGAVFYAKNGARTVGTFVQAQSDWIEDDTTDPSYILNKPPIIAGDGSYSAVENQIVPDQNADTFTFTINGDALATTFSYTYNGNLPSAANLKLRGLACYSTTKFRTITDIDTTNHTITLSSYIDTSAITDGELIIYFCQHLAVGKYSHAEGNCNYAAGNYSHTEGFGTSAIGSDSHAEGYGTKAVGMYSHTEGSNSYTKGMAAHAEGGSTEATGSYSHAEGNKTVAKGNYSHAEGYDVVARGDYSHAEGIGAWSYGHYSHAEGAYVSIEVTLSGEANVLTYTIVNSTVSSVDAGAITGSIVNATATWTSNMPVIQSVTFGEDAIVGKIVTTITLDKTLDSANAVSKNYYILVPNQAIGNYSHVEGIGNFTSGPAQGSHAEGMSVAAMGKVSHAEGISTWTKGQASHTEGTATIAGSANQHVQGKYNIEDASNIYADIIGNGSSSARSNAYTLDWNGNGWFAGKVSAGTIDTPASVRYKNDLTTKEYVDNNFISTNVASDFISKFDFADIEYLNVEGSSVNISKNIQSLYSLFASAVKTYFMVPLSQTEVIPMEISHVDMGNGIINLFAIINDKKYTIDLHQEYNEGQMLNGMSGTLNIEYIAKPAFFGGQWINYGDWTTNPQYGSHILLTNYYIDGTLYNTSLLLYAIPDYEISNTNSPLISLYKGYTESGIAITYEKDNSSPYHPVWNWDAGEHSISVSQAYVYMPKTIPSASSTTPLADGTAAVGTSTDYARADHVHPKIPIDSALSTTSENPVQNKVIQSALLNKLDFNTNYNPIPLDFPDPENPPATLDGATITCGLDFADILELYQLAIDTSFELLDIIQNHNFIVFHPFRINDANESIELFSIFDNTIYTITLEPNIDSGMTHGMIGTLHVKDSVTIDSALSSSSTNPVTNSAITTAIANNRGKVFYGAVDNTSTATAFTAQIPGITAYEEGLVVILKNGVVTSASGFTININGLGALPAYNNLGAESRETTIFNVAYTMMFIYENRVSGGNWLCYRGYDANTNTIGYQLRTNSMSLPMKSITYRYRLLFTSADGTHFVPANNTTSTNATASRAVCQDKIDPFGPIYYYGTTASVGANSRPSATYLWEQYTVALGYSFNRTGAALTLSSWKPVYVKCAPQADGSAIMDATTPYVQNLPTTVDGKIYIFLGVAYSATNIELVAHHPVYCYRNGGIQEWTGVQAEIDALTARINNLIDGDEVNY